MSPSAKLVAVIAASFAYVMAVVAAALFVLGSDLAGDEQRLFHSLLENRLGAVLAVVLIGWGLLVAILRALHQQLVIAPARAAEEASAMLEDPARRLSAQGSSELLALLDAVNRLAAQRESREADIAARIASANARAEEERNRFATLVEELAQGVVVCNIDGRILLYNRHARDLFAAPAGVARAAPLGLGRSIYAVFDRQLIAYALDNAAFPAGSGMSSRHFIAAVGAGKLLRVEVAPVRERRDGAVAAGDLPGYLLMLDDITAAFESESKRDLLLQQLTQGIRGPLGNLRAAAETMHDYPDMTAGERERFLVIVRDEAQALGNRIEAAAREFAAVVRTRWPLEEIAGADLVAAAQRRIEQRTGLAASLEEATPDLRITVDGFSLLQALTYLAARLRDEHAIRAVRLRLTRELHMAHLDLMWHGVYVNTETAVQWELEPMHATGESTPLTIRDVIDRCGGEIWFQRHRASQWAYFRFLLPLAPERRSDAPPRRDAEDATERPQFYDFDLFKHTAAGDDLDERPLTELTYTVFDTETTGLDPSGGDQIIQIGAVRIVNRRLLRNERFDQLIDPGRPLSPASTKIHGLTTEILAGQPPIEQVLPVFRDFVADTVLVGHNAAFDLRFLELKEKECGVRFDLPVLDTFLLSALVFENQESHRLEAIAQRLGVAVEGRHTALGDAIITAEVFLKLIGLLAERGIRTLKQAREASERTYHAQLRY